MNNTVKNNNNNINSDLGSFAHNVKNLEKNSFEHMHKYIDRDPPGSPNSRKCVYSRRPTINTAAIRLDNLATLRSQ